MSEENIIVGWFREGPNAPTTFLKDEDNNDVEVAAGRHPSAQARGPK
ncbi:UNVERIFIED_CONTAM: hypothetical protein RF653_10190 [Kocuria sp. CPCC 205316]